MYIAVQYIHIAYVKLLLKSYHTADTLHRQKLFLHLFFMSIIQKKNFHMKVQMLCQVTNDCMMCRSSWIVFSLPFI